MNAYELADKLDRVLQIAGCDNEIPRMLRQQADRIQELSNWKINAIQRITELENQLDKCSHHEAMAHQGGYEVGYAEGLKKANEK